MTAPDAHGPAPDTLQPAASVPFTQALRFWLKLGFISFGGPAGQIAIMHRELVEQRRWISERRFLRALNYCMLLPGPEAQQLATYIGWLMHGTRGGIAAGALFVLPALVLLIALSWVYMALGDRPAVAGFFQGVKPVVAAIVLHAVWRLGARVLRDPRHAPLPWLVALASFVALAALAVPFPWVMAGAALTGWLAARWAPAQFNPPAGGAAGNGAHAPALIDDDTPTPAHARWRPARLARVLAWGFVLWIGGLAAAWLAGGPDGAGRALVDMALFFTKAALLTFGGAYAVLPYVMQGAVVEHQWLSVAQMIDGLALGEATPGPLIMVVTFVGFLGGWSQALLGPDWRWAGGVAAALVATGFTFLPSFVFILGGGPLVEAGRSRLGLAAPLAAITAAVVGVIASLGLWFLREVLWPPGRGGAMDPAAAAVLALALWALLRWRWGVGRLIVAFGALGVLASG